MTSSSKKTRKIMRFQQRLVVFGVAFFCLCMFCIVYQNNSSRIYHKRVLAAFYYKRKVWSDHGVGDTDEEKLMQKERGMDIQSADHIENSFTEKEVENYIEAKTKREIGLIIKLSAQHRLFNESFFQKRLVNLEHVIGDLKERLSDFQLHLEKLNRQEKRRRNFEETRRIKESEEKRRHLELEEKQRQELNELRRQELEDKRRHNLEEAQIQQAALQTTTNPMLTTHKRVSSKMSDLEIKNYYNREKVSQETYGKKILDVHRDRDKLMALFPSPNENNDRITDQMRVKLNVTQNKIIFVSGYNAYTQEKFDNDKCNVNSCQITTSLADLRKADAIYGEQSIPQMLYQNKRKEQVSVFFQIESAMNYPRIEVDGLNWTATYRQDSVLNTPYEKFTPYVNVTGLPKTPLRNYAKGKTKKVAWFVSNCAGNNNRMQYVRKLQQFIQVDIYGTCGHFQCGRDDKRCADKLNNDYMFYLSFENSNCKDYVTEKFFKHGLMNDILPIVMGAHPDDYKHIAPPNSYIHVDEFSSPQQLAQYLHFLDQNDQYYNEYFLWKGTGRFINTKFMCRLCAMVHLAPHFPMWYSSSNRWWLDADTCVQPTRQNGVLYSTWRGK